MEKAESGKRKAEIINAASQIAANSNQTSQPIAHLDEISTLGETTVAEFYQERGFTVSKFNPENFPLQPAVLADLVGGDKLTNAKTARRILHGDERGPKRDAVLLNAAAALFVAGACKSLVEGWELASRLIDEGNAAKKLAQLTERVER